MPAEDTDGSAIARPAMNSDGGPTRRPRRDGRALPASKKAVFDRASARLLPALAVLLAFTAAASASDHAGTEPAGVRMTHRMMVFVLQLGVILFAAKLGGILFRKIRLPAALGELVSGMVIGPFALGGLGFYGFPEGLFAAPGSLAVSPELQAVGTLAAILLLFLVGLETDLAMLLRYAVVGGLVGVGGMAASFLFGAGIMMAFSEPVLGRSLGLFAPPCLFLGTITTATSVGITARILAERKKLDSPEGVTILSAAVIDDVMGIILLAVVMSAIGASRRTGAVDWGHVAAVGGRAVGVWLAATILGLWASSRISVLLKWFGQRTSIAVMALGMALILAGLFEEAGLAMIIGAYVMGLSLSKADITHVIREKLSPVHALLVPVFFCVTGMQIDLATLGSWSVLAFGAAYAVVALAAKVIGCGLPALVANFNLRGAARIGFGMAPRCEVALIIAGIGLAAGPAMGLMPPEVFAAVILMILVNTLVAPPAMVFLFRSPVRGTRRAAPEDDSKASPSFEFPSAEMADFFMMKLTSVFESEGFYVHRLSEEDRIYQLRKDEKVIDARCDESEITFHCRRADAPLINAAMYEALAAFEQTVRGLRQPLDRRTIQERIQEAGPLGPGTLDMRAYLSPALASPELKGETKAEIIDEVPDLIDDDGTLADRNAAREAVWERENSLSTGLQYGVAIPHGKTDAVDGLVCAVGLKREGVDFDALDGEPSRIFILTLSPRSKTAPHIQFMSTVSQLLNEVGRRRILECRTAQDLYRAFTTPPPPERKAPPAPAAGPPPGRFDPSRYLRPELLKPELTAATREDAIRELINVLATAGELNDAEAAANAVLDREAQMSTGMEKGLAVPHGRTEAVNGLICALGVHREGIDFGAADGQPARIIMLVLTPPSGADPYLQFVASVIGVLDDAGRRRVLGAASREELHAALTE